MKDPSSKLLPHIMEVLLSIIIYRFRNPQTLIPKTVCVYVCVCAHMLVYKCAHVYACGVSE